MRVNYHIWSGVKRRPNYTPPPGDALLLEHGIRIHRVGSEGMPTVVVDMHLRDWALPLSLHLGGPLLGKPGVTVRIGPVNIGWSKL